MIEKKRWYNQWISNQTYISLDSSITDTLRASYNLTIYEKIYILVIDSPNYYKNSLLIILILKYI